MVAGRFQAGLPRRFVQALNTSADALIIRPGNVYENGENGLPKASCVAAADQRAGASARRAASKYS
jgi:hypothetical protein